MKVAIIGCRGIPAEYGGFETFAEGLTEYLPDEELDITVSCEYKPQEHRHEEYNCAKLVYFPLKPPQNYLLRKFYENLSDIYFLIKLSRSSDLIYFLGIEVGMFMFLPKLFNRKSKVIVNIDGVMWKRSKFNFLERWLLKINHDLATVFADTIIVDSKQMKKFIDKNKLDKTRYLSYGIKIPERITWNDLTVERLKDYTPIDITPGNYFLLVARLEPENNIHTIVDAYSKAKVNIPLLVVGDFTSTAYQEEVTRLAQECSAPGVIFLGSIYDDELLDMLRQNCTAYIHGHSVGGTNPSLLEAAASKNIIIAHQNPFNWEVCKTAALYFNNENDLALKLKSISRHPEGYSDLKNRVCSRVKNNYLWEHIATGYLSLFRKINAEREEKLTRMEAYYEGKRA
ncbi:MAG: hypothetical protein PWQ15_1739 [Methanobacterium sp.]|uniref:DUF1972 domain-containing protein n=1 Tax=Methanobacterium sp. TaxID=2164 RepID=UPI0003C98263|nr:DUF1972 domain-containing protein [Methanobacterium sp.]MDI3550636.1 hypothetical protein [Methanobacterium sp.]CDG65078.1 Glycosyltransferase [Methanobacterium sp. MB1]